jgi:hypothetical protein
VVNTAALDLDGSLLADDFALAHNPPFAHFRGDLDARARYEIGRRQSVSPKGVLDDVTEEGNRKNVNMERAVTLNKSTTIEKESIGVG